MNILVKSPFARAFVALIAFLLLLWSCAPPPAHAATNRNCAPRPMVLAGLADQYGEVRKSIGTGSDGVVIETFASAETGTWTITRTTPDGFTCLVASGYAFEALDEEMLEGDPT